MYFYKENIEEKEEEQQKVYYINNDIVLTNFKYIKKNNIKNIPKKRIVIDTYDNIKDEKNKMNYYNANLKNIVFI